MPCLLSSIDRADDFMPSRPLSGNSRSCRCWVVSPGASAAIPSTRMQAVMEHEREACTAPVFCEGLIACAASCSRAQ